MVHCLVRTVRLARQMTRCCCCCCFCGTMKNACVQWALAAFGGNSQIPFKDEPIKIGSQMRRGGASLFSLFTFLWFSCRSICNWRFSKQCETTFTTLQSKRWHWIDICNAKNNRALYKKLPFILKIQLAGEAGTYIDHMIHCEVERGVKKMKIWRIFPIQYHAIVYAGELITAFCPLRWGGREKGYKWTRKLFPKYLLTRVK